MLPSRLTSRIRSLGLVAIASLALVAGVGTVIKLPVDELLLRDAAAAAENWARYVAENVADIDDIANGSPPSADSMQFFIRSQQIRHVFGFEIIDMQGNVQLSSDGFKIVNVLGTVHNETAARAAMSGQPIVAVKEGIPPVRPRYYSEAYLPVLVDGTPQAIVAAYVNLTEQHDLFRAAFLRTAFALCLLTGIAVGVPTLALHRRTKEKQRSDERAHYLALHDALTGLPNRLNLIEKLHAAFASASSDGSGIAVHFIDLDRFKEINDMLGHDGGDFMLKTTAERLQDTAGAMGTAARLGGDEFVVLQANVRNRTDVEEFARRAAAALSAPIWFNEQEIMSSASIGVALGPGDGADPDRLLKSADLALYESKADGRNCIRFFTPEMDIDRRERIKLQKAVRDAVANDRFELHYQPIYGLPGGRLAGFEALARLRSDDGTFIPPKVFIPVAEDLRLIGRLGAWVVQEACRTAATWPEHLSIAVNLSPAEFVPDGVSKTVAAALADNRLEPRRLEIEITETLMLGDSETVMSELRTLQRMGVAIVMDDFGTGYSSLNYLWRFPFDKLKIDRSFMLGLDDSARDVQTVVKTIIALGRELNMRVTVEGVENAKQLAFAGHAQADQAQGYLLGRPMPVSDVAAHILTDFQSNSCKGGLSGESEVNLRLVQ